MLVIDISLDELIGRARQATPLIDGDRVTFVWIGSPAPQLVGDFNGWGWQNGPADLELVGPDVWAHGVTLPRNVYVEYAFRMGEEEIGDPFNPRVSKNGMGSIHNFFFMPDAAEAPLTKPQRGVPRGTVTRHVIENDFMLAGRRRTVHLYRPPVEVPTPLLVVLDGQDYIPRGHIIRIVDNLIHEGRIRPISMALVNHGRQARVVEYHSSDATLAYLVRDVLPLARERLNLVDVETAPGSYGILGASMGGLMSMYAGIRLPHVFGHVLSQSGSFALDMNGAESVVFPLLRDGDVRPLRIWMDVGIYEWLLNANRAMYALLRDKGYDVNYREYPGAHNYTSWRNDVWRGLETLYGPGAAAGLAAVS